MSSSTSPQVIGVSTEIGRGHPHYLDCVWQVLERKLKPEALQRINVFDTSHGLSLLGWQGLRALYRVSARNRVTIALYNSLRRGQSNSHVGDWVLKLLGRDLRNRMKEFGGICLVEHQLTARILSSVCRTWYLHADVAAPPECAFPGPEKVFVPLADTERGFLACGQPGSHLVRTALMIEPELVTGAETAVSRRLERLSSDRPLRVAFSTSGAYPAPHIRKLNLGTESVLEQGMQAVVFCGTDARFLKEMTGRAATWKAETDINQADPAIREPKSELTLIARPDRIADTSAAAAIMPEVDVLVAPCHERVNWSLGLGLPLFALFPMIGTHARLNYEFCRKQGVAIPITSDADARALGATLNQLRRDGTLTAMVQSGFGHLPIDGAERTANEIIAQIGEAGAAKQE